MMGAGFSPARSASPPSRTYSILTDSCLCDTRDHPELCANHLLMDKSLKEASHRPTMNTLAFNGDGGSDSWEGGHLPEGTGREGR